MIPYHTEFIKEAEELFGSGNIKENCPMKNYTSFKIGGPCDIILFPENKIELIHCLHLCKKYKINTLVIGNGSNLLVSDKGIRGAVIYLSGRYKSYSVEEDKITADSGIMLSFLAKLALHHSLSGLEFAEGIPGTLGGAVFMNAGAYGGEMADIVHSTEYLDEGLNECVIKGQGHMFLYRHSIFQEKPEYIITASTLLLCEGDKEKIQLKMNQNSSRRKEKQPVDMPSAGSVFKRPAGMFTAPMIEKCGLKGLEYGGAQVSAKHCGFIVNKGNATAKDILTLIEIIKEKVYNEFKVELIPEIRFVGEMED